MGFDPGTTSGYAALNLDGELVRISSGKELTVSSLISELTGLGRVVVIGTDKKRVPSHVRELATKLGARIVSPDEDLSRAEKRDSGIEEAKNKHETDALASALMAYNSVKGVIHKTRELFEGKQQMQRAMTLALTRENQNLRILADKFLEKTESMNAEGKRKKTINEISGLKEKYIALKQENSRLKAEQNKLKRKVSKLKNANYKLRSRDWEKDVDAKARKKLMHLEGARKFLEQKIYHREKQISELQGRVTGLKDVLARASSHAMMKRFKDFSSQEFRKSRVQNGDLIFVDNPNVYSEEVVAHLNKSARLIMVGQPALAKIRARLDIPVLSSNGINIEFIDDFAVISKEELEQARKSHELLSRIVLDYQKSRT